MQVTPGSWQSLVVALKCKDGVVLAGTKSVTYAYLRITQQGRSIFVVDNVGLGFSGHLADLQNVIREIEFEMRYWKHILNRKMTVKAVAHRLSLLLFSWKFFPMITFAVVAGYSNEDHDFKLYVLDPVGSILEENYAAAGISEEMAIGLLEDRWKENLTIQEGKRIAIDLLKVVSRRDIFSTGKFIDVAVIKKDYAKLEEVEIPM